MDDILARFRADAKARRGWLGEVAAGTGISRKTLRSYIDIPNRDPAYSRVEKLRRFYESHDKPAA